MRRIVYPLFAAAMVVMGSCQDELVENPVIPAQTGDEITFGSSLTDVDALTRTIYGDEPVTDDKGTYYPVTWEDGDQIAIYCPEASNGNMVYYKVTPDGSDASTSSAVTKVNPDQAGLQWGAEEEHHFSAFYPATQITGLQDGKITATIPVQQTPVSWKTTDNDAGGKTYTGVANTDYAFMWAYNTHKKSLGGDVALNFKPWVTILDVEINGPETAGAEIKMSAVQLVSTTGETLNGEFKMDFTAVETGEAEYPTYEQAGNPASTRSYITIQLYDQSLNGGKGDFITLKHGDKIVVRFYLLPRDTNYDTSGRTDLQLRVTPYNSAVLTRKLNAENGTQTGGILAHKVNKVILPSVSQTGPNYWMSSLDPNIYVTELSLPGSKMSYQTEENGANVPYQTSSIAEQFKNGIRAFQLQTASLREGSGGTALNYWDEDEINLHLIQTVAGEATETEFKTVVAEIANGLKAAEGAHKTNEYAFILLTMSEGACEEYHYRVQTGTVWGVPTYERFTVSGKLAWMDAIKEDLDEMAADDETYRLYTGEITPSTTIDDVKGHIIIKVNYNDNDMANRLSDSDRIPAMFSQWGLREDVEDFNETSAYAVNAMRWGTSNNADAGSLQWFYHEATSVGYNNTSGGDYGESSDVKIANIEDMWNRSINYYKDNDDHKMWFLNDLGGSYVNTPYSSGESKAGVEAWTQYVGPYATRLLQNRTEDATLGIVLINYANPKNDYSGNLIQTIINNNFSFQLRTRGSSQSNVYNASYSKGGNAIGWD